MNTIMLHELLQKAGFRMQKSKLQEFTIEQSKSKLKDDKDLWKHIMVYASKIRSNQQLLV